LSCFIKKLPQTLYLIRKVRLAIFIWGKKMTGSLAPQNLFRWMGGNIFIYYFNQFY